MMSDQNNDNLKSLISEREYRFVLIVGVVALAITSVSYVLGAALATEDRVFGGFVYATEDTYSYLAKMRQGAEGAWLFHIAYTSESHMGTLFFPFHLLLGKIAALLPGVDLAAKMVWVYHVARWVFGLGLLLTVYRFLAAFTEQVAVRRVAWLMVTFGGGLGWLIVALGQSDWLGFPPLDFILPEGFTFLVLYAFPHIALGRMLLLWGILFLIRAWDVEFEIPNLKSQISRLRWGSLTGLSWLLMGLIVPFYVPVAWAVMGATWLVLCVRHRRVMWREGWLAAIPALISAPVVAYSLWVFSSDPVYAVWSAQNLILSPHPLHYLAAYGVSLLLAAFAVLEVWRSEKPAWLTLAWVGVVPFLVYLPFNLQRRLVEGVQVPLSLLAAWGLVRISNLKSQTSSLRRWLVVSVVLVAMSLTNVLIVSGNCLTLRWRPAQIYRGVAEVAALDWLGERTEADDVVLSSYETGNYLPARVWARVFVGHGPETVYFAEKKALMARFFGAATDDVWRQDLLDEYGIDYVFWGPAERRVGSFDPHAAPYLRAIYDADGYTVFEVEQ
ncbi:MAG: hypothetical protein JXA14_07080 [Anaerolineae bacterium]|nr:hypothetical protein [Anaerolineae bacterium]